MRRILPDLNRVKKVTSLVDTNRLIDQVDPENLYTHILRTEGVKHPVFGPEKLEECADYILDQFSGTGLENGEQQIQIEGFDYELRNIGVSIRTSSEPDLEFLRKVCQSTVLTALSLGT